MARPIIKLINYGIACRIANTIYINRKLLKHPALLKKILKHELQHSPSFIIKDFLMDLHNEHLEGNKLEFYLFVLTTPSSWYEFLPFGKYAGSWVINPTLLLFWTGIIAIGGIIWML